MNRLLTVTTKLSAVTVFVAFIFFVPETSFAGKKSEQKKSSRAQSCLKLGQGQTLSGIGQSESKLPEPCCKPLKAREPQETCGVPASGGSQYVCLACGDNKCDPDRENTCNCPEDCK